MRPSPVLSTLLALLALGGALHAQGGAPDTVLPPRPAGNEAAAAPPVAKPGDDSPGSGATAGGASAEARVETPGALELSWDIWWHFHQHEFLGLRSRVHAGQLVPKELQADPLLAALLARAPRPLEAEIASQVEPRLIALVEGGPGGELVAGALMGLARLGARSGREPSLREFDCIEARIASPVRGIAETAVLSLGILGSERALESLAALARDDERGRALARLPAVPYRMRSLAAYGLGLIGQATRSQRTRQFVCRTLTDVVEGASAPATDTQVACLLALGMTPLDSDPRGPRGAPWLSRETQLDYLERSCASRERGRLLRAHACASLARLASSASDGLREPLARRMLERLERGEDDALLREAGLLGLGELCQRGSTPTDLAAAEALLATLAGSAQNEADAARLALLELVSRPPQSREHQKLLQRARERLLAGTHASTARTRAWSAFALGALEARLTHAGSPGSPSVREALRALWARETSPDAQSACALALGLAGDTGAAPLLLERLARGGDDALRGYCALGLGLCGDPQSAEALRTILRQSTHRPFVLESCAIALGLLGEKAVVEDLLAGLEDSLSQTSQGWFALAVGQVGDARALPVLIERLKDEKLTRRSRAYLAVALGMICESAELPWIQPISGHLAWRATSETLFNGNGQGVLELL